MSNELKNLTVRYISKCDDVIKSKSEEQAKQLQIQIISAYENLIKNISSNLTYDFPDFNGSGYIYRASYLKNIGILKSKLEAFSTNISDLPKTKLNGKEIIITNNNTNNNTNINTNNLEVIFKQAKENINKDESLSEEEIKEILEKIDEIEEVSKLDEARNKKWFKLRNLMNWLGTKGVNIAINILPLITEILKFND